MKDKRMISELNRTFRAGERRAKTFLDKKPKEFNLVQSFEGNSLLGSGASSNGLYEGDNLEIMRAWYWDENIKGKIKLFYLDPPFFTMSDQKAVVNTEEGKVKSKAYKDSWEDGMKGYLKMLYPRIYLMKELLADDGLIFVHVDWHAAHFVRMMMDDIFGADNFINEIIWQYKSGGSSKKHFARKHDNIFLYSKGKKYKINIPKEKSYNRGFKPYRFKGVEEFKDEIGWYTLVNMKDVWEIDMVGRTSAERTGYATQKPEQLMNRIIESASQAGDLVADPFCGSGSFGVASAKQGRNFLMADSGELAIAVTRDRLIKEGLDFHLYKRG